MKFKKSLVAAVMMGLVSASMPSLASAEYVVAYHQERYEETILVDTGSIFEEGHYSFNVLVYKIITNGEKETKTPNTYHLKYDDGKNTWMSLVKDKEGKDEWIKVEKGSYSQDVLKACMPYLKK